jgi:hypothetical protein
MKSVTFLLLYRTPPPVAMKMCLWAASRPGSKGSKGSEGSEGDGIAAFGGDEYKKSVTGLPSGPARHFKQSEESWYVPRLRQSAADQFSR